MRGPFYFSVAAFLCTNTGAFITPLAPLRLKIDPSIRNTTAPPHGRFLTTSGNCGQYWSYCIQEGTIWLPSASQCNYANAWRSISASWSGSAPSCTCVVNCPQTNAWSLVCPAGYVGVGQNGFTGQGSCKDDTRGLCSHFKTWDDKFGACYPCIVGAYCPGGTGLTYMYACPAGYFCPATTPTSPTFTYTSRPCTVGNYCPGQVGAPIPCPAGTFGASALLQTAACSGQCAQGKCLEPNRRCPKIYNARPKPNPTPFSRQATTVWQGPPRPHRTCAPLAPMETRRGWARRCALGVATWAIGAPRDRNPKPRICARRARTAPCRAKPRPRAAASARPATSAPRAPSALRRWRAPQAASAPHLVSLLLPAPGSAVRATTASRAPPQPPPRPARRACTLTCPAPPPARA